jgi:FKBP-type peptidyl-prolyl cis-trans isomerase SlyD
MPKPSRRSENNQAKIGVHNITESRDHMKIEQDTVVTLRYKVADAAGKAIEESSDPLSYLHGGYGGTWPKIEAALHGQESGYQVTLQLHPEDAFGQRDESLVRTIPKKEFPPGVKVGGQLQGRDDDGHEVLFNVLKIKGDNVLLDGNHPLAGRELRFTVKVTEVRAASEEEITHRHAHGSHGHHHA